MFVFIMAKREQRKHHFVIPSMQVVIDRNIREPVISSSYFLVENGGRVVHELYVFHVTTQKVMKIKRTKDIRKSRLKIFIHEVIKVMEHEVS